MMSIKHRSGITLIELLVVLGILGILSITVYPAVVNVLRVRSLETATRDIMMDLNRAKVLAVRNKTEARVLFAQAIDGSWTYVLQEEAADGTWAIPSGAIRKTISTDFQVAINLPDQNVEYSPLGIVQNFAAGPPYDQNVIRLSSEKVRALHQPDVRSLVVYGGGSIQYVKSSTA